ncbi:hypothetical protein L9F63_009413, partial [Diploptera punctata]
MMMEMLEDDGMNLLDSDMNVSYANMNNNINVTVLWEETTVLPSPESVKGNVSVNVSSGGGEVFESDLIIPLYVVIFVLAIVGNSLVLITLAQNKRMRTVTNVYLLNLVLYNPILRFY